MNMWDCALAGIKPQSLICLVELISMECAIRLWHALPDELGVYARAVLEWGDHRYDASLIQAMWPWLEEFLRVKSDTDAGCCELLDMQIHDAFLDAVWPHLKRAMLRLGELTPRNKRLLAHYWADRSEFATLVITSITLNHANHFAHAGLKRLRLPHSFGEMLWISRWWMETRNIGVVVRARGGERWVPRSRHFAVYDTETNEPARLLPCDPPLRGRTEFTHEDAAWILAESERRKNKRRQQVNCPECGAYDPTAQHMRTGDGYMCANRITKKRAPRAVPYAIKKQRPQKIGELSKAIAKPKRTPTANPRKRVAATKKLC
ncbi:uncharacterized protein ACA1_337590 [Acanthamoeba castellanii str. Neff]|uniref:Uncharacterized protein n=1 Tax=Acanthamoeba castellanii (strain ATCC 30010 / Neff) TaxID=1257118 RepID=L8GPY3_ACACF|nr:uncharacterized protein ACA1_337590 [Acanthamoeba castellanii str. Neff]ELR14703.1 hypothetical protein ACA1_337590 [Acanthamoeba castellanii str. Neff]